MRGKIAGVCVAHCIAACMLSKAAWAGEALFYKEANLVGGYSSRDRWVDKSPEQVSSVGFEYFRKFSGEYGDYLTTDVQARIAYDSTQNAEHAWGLQIHNAWLLYKLGLGTKVRAGHFDPAFGLEPQLDTHATLLQTLAMEDIGFNKDWGVGLEGELFKFDYKTALQLGSGMSIYRKDGSFLWTGRLGTPTTHNLQYGVSLLYGRVLETEGANMNTYPWPDLVSNKTILKKRVGLDGQYLFGPYLFKAEAAYGQNDHENVLGYLTEVDYTVPRCQNLELELQFQSFINELGRSYSDDTALTAGASYKLSQTTALRAAYSHDFNVVGEKREDKFVVQFYFLGA